MLFLQEKQVKRGTVWPRPCVQVLGKPNINLSPSRFTHPHYRDGEGE